MLRQSALLHVYLRSWRHSSYTDTAALSRESTARSEVPPGIPVSRGAGGRSAFADHLADRLPDVKVRAERWLALVISEAGEAAWLRGRFGHPARPASVVPGG